MLINLSNHPSKNWDEKQITQAKKQFGTIVDMSFPKVDPAGDEDYIRQLAASYFKNVVAIFDECTNEPYPKVVHIQGEFTFVYAMVKNLTSSGIRCIASTTNRNATENGNGEKIVKFTFVRFREYK
jgi:hypothetical protein